MIKDDLDDQRILGEIFKELKVPNEVFYFANGVDAYAFLLKSKHQRFIILSDINLPP